MYQKEKSQRCSSAPCFERLKTTALRLLTPDLLLCFAIPMILMYLLYLVIKIYPFGDGSVLVLDMNAQYVYYFEAFREAILGDGSLLYSFSRTLGGEFFGIYLYYLASPLSYIVLLFPQDMMLEAILVIVLIKVGLCGYTFGFYLRQHTKKPNKVLIIAFSCLYSLSAYAVVYQNNTMWIDALIWLPIITYGIEQLVANKRYKLYVISLAVAIMSNYYIGYMICIYSAAYFLYAYFSLSEHTEEKRRFLRSSAVFAAYSVLAAAISAISLFGAYYSLSFGKTDFSNPNFLPYLKFNVVELFTKLFVGSYDTVDPDGLPFIYCGTITLLLIPVYFLSKRIQRKEKLASAAFILFFIASFAINTLDLIWHGFQKPNWLNYRYSFMLCFFLLILAYKGFGLLERSKEKVLILTTAVIIVFLLIAKELTLESFVVSENSLSKISTVAASICLSVVILILLLLFIRLKFKKTLTLILTLVICGELVANGIVLMAKFDADVIYSSRSSYTDYVSGLRETMTSLKNYDSEFYRSEKIPQRKFNDNFAIGINGVSNSTSTLHSDSIKFLRRLGYVSQYHFSQYRGGNPVGDSLLGIKYIIDNTELSILDDIYPSVISDEKYTVYQNPYALSIAYGVSDSLENFDLYKYDSQFESMNALVSAMLGGNSDVKIYEPISDYQVLGSNCTTSKNEKSFIYTPKSSKKDSAVNFTFTAPYDGSYFFYPKCEQKNEVKLWINTRYYGTYLTTKTDSIISLGYFDKGDSITVKLELQDGKSFYLLEDSDCIWYLDNTAFTESFNKLSKNPQFIIDEYSDTHFNGSIDTTEDDQTILLTLPYDSGWKIYVDGKRVETSRSMDALISFVIDSSGKHSVTMEYCPNAYWIGAIISIVSLLLFSAIIFITRKTKYSSRSLMWDIGDEADDISDTNTHTNTNINQHGGT